MSRLRLSFACGCSVILMTLCCGLMTASNTPEPTPRKVIEQQEVIAVFDRECIEALKPGLDYHIEAKVDRVTGNVKPETAEGVGRIDVKLSKTCQPRLQVRRKHESGPKN